MRWSLRVMKGLSFEGLLEQNALYADRIISLPGVSQGCLKSLLDRIPFWIESNLYYRPCWTVGLYDRTIVFNKNERPLQGSVEQDPIRVEALSSRILSFLTVCFHRSPTIASSSYYKKICLCSPAYEHDPRTTMWSPLPSMEGCLLSLGPEAFPLKARIWKQPLLLTVDSFQEQGLVSFESLY